MKNYSQFDEQQMLIEIFEKIGFKYKKSVEFGAGDGHQLSNTRHFCEEHNFTGIFWDIKPKSDDVEYENVLIDNINHLFFKYGLAEGCDLMSIDIDGNDFWIWRHLEYKPRVVIVEFNRWLPKGKQLTIPYQPNFEFDETVYYGASWDAFLQLGISKGYTLVNNNNLNMIFVLSSELKNIEIKSNLDYENGQGWGIDKLKRQWYNITEGKLQHVR